ncbi:hypothetical protein KCP70_02780 [Salmonella enterica subsp. enterica]|nr:hypothetical protein KCP70_02780 [Salmonella enterica subsp. enterica]
MLPNGGKRRRGLTVTTDQRRHFAGHRARACRAGFAHAADTADGHAVAGLRPDCLSGWYRFVVMGMAGTLRYARDQQYGRRTG